MLKRKLVLISGKKYSGKDTLADMFEEKDEDHWLKLALANELKDQLYIVLTQILELPDSDCNMYSGDKERSLGIKLADGTDLTIRKAMQDYGQLMKKIFGQYYWVDKLEAFIKDYVIEDYNIIVSDCRFLYEIEELTKRFETDTDIYTIRIKRNTSNILPKVDPFMDIQMDNDISETDLDLILDTQFDFVIENDGTINDLKNSFDNIFNYIK